MHDTYNPIGTVTDPATQRELMRIAATLEQLYTKGIEVTYVAPEKPSDGQVAICDGVNWNPIGGGIKQPVWYNGSAWTSFVIGPVIGVVNWGNIVGTLSNQTDLQAALDAKEPLGAVAAHDGAKYAHNTYLSRRSMAYFLSR